MKKLIFIFTFIYFSSLYSASIPQGLITKTKNGVTRITTSNPDFKLVMEIWGNNTVLKWESIFKNDKGFIYSKPTIYGYDYGEKISDFGDYKLFSIPIEDFGQILTSGNYITVAPYVIDIQHPVYSVNNIRYLIYAFILDPLESTELYGYRSGLYSQYAYITLTKKDMEEVKKLLEYYIDYTKENNINIFYDYINNNNLNHDEVFTLLKNQYKKVQQLKEERRTELNEYENRFSIKNNILIYNGDKIVLEADINNYSKYLKTRNNILSRTLDYNQMTDYMETQKDFRYYLTLKEIKNLSSIEFQHTEYKLFNVYSDEISKNTITINFLPYTQNEIKINNKITTLFLLLSDNDKNAINRDFESKLYNISK